MHTFMFMYTDELSAPNYQKTNVWSTLSGKGVRENRDANALGSYICFKTLLLDKFTEKAE